jgi:hypothetical protein
VYVFETFSARTFYQLSTIQRPALQNTTTTTTTKTTTNRFPDCVLLPFPRNKVWDTYPVRPREGSMILLVATNGAFFRYPLYMRTDTEQFSVSFQTLLDYKIRKNSGAKCDAPSPELHKTAQYCISDIATNCVKSRYILRSHELRLLMHKELQQNST